MNEFEFIQEHEGIRAGDTVKLFSGGALMTVESIQLFKPENLVVVGCCWMSERGKLRRDTFNPSTLYIDTGQIHRIARGVW